MHKKMMILAMIGFMAGLHANENKKTFRDAVNMTNQTLESALIHITSVRREAYESPRTSQHSPLIFACDVARYKIIQLKSMVDKAKATDDDKLTRKQMAEIADQLTVCVDAVAEINNRSAWLY